MMKKLLEKIFTASDKAVVTFAAVVATLVTAWTLAVADFDEFTLEIIIMILANAWLVVEAAHFED